MRGADATELHQGEYLEYLVEGADAAGKGEKGGAVSSGDAHAGVHESVLSRAEKARGEVGPGREVGMDSTLLSFSPGFE